MKQWIIDHVVMGAMWPLMPRRVKFWAFMNDETPGLYEAVRELRDSINEGSNIDEHCTHP